MSSKGIGDKAKRQRIFARDGYRCVQCGSGDDLTIDHVVPLVAGGGNGDRNLQTLCRVCNEGKAAAVGQRSPDRRLIKRLEKPECTENCHEVRVAAAQVIWKQRVSLSNLVTKYRTKAGELDLRKANWRDDGERHEVLSALKWAREKNDLQRQYIHDLEQRLGIPERKRRDDPRFTPPRIQAKSAP